MSKEGIKTAYDAAKHASQEFLTDRNSTVIKSLQQSIEPIKHRIKESVIYQKTEKRIKLKIAENVLLDTPRNYPEEYEEDVARHGEDPNTLFVIVGNHASHVGAFTLMEEAEHIRGIVNKVRPPESQISGSAFLFAGSINGGQNEGVTDNWKGVQPILDDLNVERVFVFRQRDIDNLQLDKAQIKKVKEEERKNLNEEIDLNKIIQILAEGTVQAGRRIKNKDGQPTEELTGMMPFVPGSIGYIEALARRKGKKVVFVPVGNEGENKIFDPNIENRTVEAKKFGLKKLVPIWKHRLDPIMKSAVGHPISYKQIVETYGNNGVLSKGFLEQFLGEVTGQLVPYIMRGVYKNPTLLDHAENIKIRRSPEVFSEKI